MRKLFVRMSRKVVVSRNHLIRVLWFSFLNTCKLSRISVKIENDTIAGFVLNRYFSRSIYVAIIIDFIPQKRVQKVDKNWCNSFMDICGRRVEGELVILCALWDQPRYPRKTQIFWQNLFYLFIFFIPYTQKGLRWRHL